MKKDLRDLTHAETRAFAGELGVEPYRGDQIFRWVHGRRVARVEAMTDLAKELRARVADAAEVRTLAVDAEQVSRDGTRKLRLRTGDGRMIETVLIPDGDAAAPDDDLDEGAGEAAAGGEAGERTPEHLQHALFPKRPKLTQCVSSQVGCALDCSFCATAKLGFGRQLTAGEIVDQVYRAQDIVGALGDDDPTRRAGADRVTNLVFMGMGEPLHNYENVVRALAILTDPTGADFSRRRITVSTAGLVPGIEKLAAETRTALRVNLAVSLNATTDEVRDVHHADQQELEHRARCSRRCARSRSRSGAASPSSTCSSTASTTATPTPSGCRELLRGIPSKVNLIPWNPHELTDGTIPIAARRDERVRAFQAGAQGARPRRLRAPPARRRHRRRLRAARRQGRTPGSYLYVHRKLARSGLRPLSLEHAERACSP